VAKSIVICDEFLLGVARQTFLKSANAARSYSKNKSTTFLRTRSTVYNCGPMAAPGFVNFKLRRHLREGWRESTEPKDLWFQFFLQIVPLKQCYCCKNNALR